MSAANGALSRQIILGLAGVIIIAACYFITTLPYGRAIHDLFVLLDGSYRISVGQMPHVDFQSPIGPLLLFTMRAGQILVPDGNPFVVYHGLTWLLLVPALMQLGPRFPSNRSFVAALSLYSLMMLLPMTLDQTSLSEISYFASYNRFGSGLLFLIGLWYVLPKGKVDGLLLAYILFLAILIKVTAAMVGAGILIAAVILGRARWRVGLETLVFLAIMLLALEAGTGMVSGYWADIATMIALNESSGLYALVFYAFRNWIVLTIMGVTVLTALWTFYKQTDFASEGIVAPVVALWKREAFIVDMVLLVVAAWGAESQNTGGLGLICAAALLFHPAAWTNYRIPSLLLLVTMLFPILDMTVKRSLKIIIREKVAAPVQPFEKLAPGTRVPFTTYEGARLFDEIMKDQLEQATEAQNNRFFFTYDPTSNAPAARLAFHTKTAEAAKLFEERGYRKLANNYSSLVFSDPFARLLGLTPAKGTMLTMDADRTVPRFTPDQARDYLRNTDGLFVERCDMTDEQLGRQFDPVLETDFDRYPLNICWDFYARKGVD